MKANTASVSASKPGNDDLVIMHEPLVKRIAFHLMNRLPPSVQADDLIQAGSGDDLIRGGRGDDVIRPHGGADTLLYQSGDNGADTIDSFQWNGTSGSFGTPMTISGVGNFTLLSNGSYTFEPVANYTGLVPQEEALQAGRGEEPCTLRVVAP